MKKRDSTPVPSPDGDTMRPEYDFSSGARGKTASRYAEGSNVVTVDPDVLDVFPDEKSVNETLRAIAPLLRQRKKRRSAA